MSDEKKLPVMFPVNTEKIVVSEAIQAAVYEVYSVVYAPQPSLMFSESCRGGFYTSELMAYLWARQFDRSQWRQQAEWFFSNIAKAKRD